MFKQRENAFFTPNLQEGNFRYQRGMPLSNSKFKLITFNRTCSILFADNHHVPVELYGRPTYLPTGIHRLKISGQ